MKTITLIIPCYNEEANVPAVYGAAEEATHGLAGYEVRYLFIDDGSTDDTLKNIQALAQADDAVYYISFSRNFGKEAAMFAGLENAGTDLVAVLDADLQDPPALIPEMLQHIEDGYEICATRRVSRKGEPPIRSLFARMFYKFINKMTGLNVVDGARDFRVMTRKAVNAILAMREKNRFSKGIFSWIGFETKWLEYENIERIHGETKWSFFKLFNYAIDGIISFTTKPLRIASVVGVIGSAASFIYLLFIVIRTLIFGIDLPGYASTLAVLLFAFSLLLLFMGIQGEYMARMYMEIKDRPIYIVGKTNLKQSAGEGD